MSDAPSPVPASMTLAERLARAVLLFYRASPWTAQDRATWLALTGSPDATTRVLGNLARAVLGKP